ncbi:MAG: ATP-binding cassette domain-containing protein, partial [Gammaproteobacteria bacterium]|nr:ATP-binding cassette domain-containing protein [Phycisphaerae bacterium]NIQ75546.1 ATP-binding cassette domain-containing protein [Gammaproteobacteria bacterium]NIP56245.1 ATP-binding cassette domain-containing protein [Phycisphaerae bacterium]NIR92744.1 ATP-binding cassette domain-containing protein [Gammaproteobacteria bacterium]NIW48411.1 ATP-binding cassette domain-containing protein [Gammaproteobacteria bacterium]
MSVLSVRHLRKSFRSVQVVNDVSLTVHAGEIIGLLGPNGAGKTTSFHMIVGIIPCENGTIHINRQEISNMPMDERSHLGLGYLPQETSVFRRLTVAENIMAILETRPHLTEQQRNKRLDTLLR